jgi:hypothetical protein
LIKRLRERQQTVKYQTLPLDLNKIAVRFENLEDLFDYPSDAVLNDTTVYIDVPAFA